MCLNFVLSDNSDWIKHHFAIFYPKLEKKEIFPNYSCPIIRADFGGDTFRIDLAHFGLISSWVQYLNKNSLGRISKTSSQNKSLLSKFSVETYNARIETVATKPSFRTSWKHKHFEILVIDSFFQPKYTINEITRWSVHQKNGFPLALACLWEMSHDLNTGKDILSFCILTEDANNHAVLKQFHSPEQAKRMPIILPEFLLTKWLTANLQESQEILLTTRYIDLEAQALDHYPTNITKSKKLTHQIMRQ